MTIKHKISRRKANAVDNSATMGELLSTALACFTIYKLAALKFISPESSVTVMTCGAKTCLFAFTRMVQTCPIPTSENR